ncbi:hypothetical protein D3C81_1097760 [compost metagenome]
MAKVEVDQVFPFLGRTPLQGDPGAGVATAAGLAELLVKLLNRVQATFHGIPHTLGFAGCQALLVGQVLDQGAAVIVADLQTMHDLHAADAHQPAFGGFALVTDAAIAVVAFGCVTAHALALQQVGAGLFGLELGA